MKKIKILFYLIIASLVLNNCGSVKNAMDPQRKNNTDEFLVEKKSPLSMPPDFEKLPLPKDQKLEKVENEEDNFKNLIVNSQSNNNEIKNKGPESSGNFEKLLIEKIKNN